MLNTNHVISQLEYSDYSTERCLSACRDVTLDSGETIPVTTVDCVVVSPPLRGSSTHKHTQRIIAVQHSPPFTRSQDGKHCRHRSEVKETQATRVGVVTIIEHGCLHEDHFHVACAMTNRLGVFGPSLLTLSTEAINNSPLPRQELITTESTFPSPP